MLRLQESLLFFLLAISIVLASVSNAQDTNVLNATDLTEATNGRQRDRLPGLQSDSRVLLPNGWSLKPEGVQIAMGDFPSNVQQTSDGKFAAVLHCGYGAHEVRIVSLVTNTVISSATLPRSFYGLAFCNRDSTLAVSGGEDETILLYPFNAGYLGQPKSLEIVDPQQTFVVSGITPLDGSTELVVCGLLGHQVRVVSQADGRSRFSIDTGELSYPYTAVVDAAKKLAYVSLWGQSSVIVADLASGKVTKTLTTLSHPTEMRLIEQGRVLLVACSNDNSIVMIDTDSGKQLEVIRTSLYSRAPGGSTPASLSVSSDEKVLVAANADNNNLAVFKLGEREEGGRRDPSQSLGFIPVGWYPTSVRFSVDDKSILVTNGKGMTSRSNVHGPNPNATPPTTVREYVGGLMQGTLSVIATPSPSRMAAMTRQAYACSPLDAELAPTSKADEENHPIPRSVGQLSPIKHCIYIIKENRTYDQVFGDVPDGNGDASLCIFPEQITPNHHALAKQFVLLDNFYVESEVSADGHEWTMAAYATDFVEKTWPLNYRPGGGKLGYPAEGKLAISVPTTGYLWDRCREKGVSYFSFGEFVDNGPRPGEPATSKVAALDGHFDPLFRSYDLDYPDAKRADRFIERWQQFEQDGNTPQLTILRLPNDHTYGTRVGKPTPTAMVADNDLALGRVVEAVSRSKAWPTTAMFVVEDDAQNGADHVDAHRTVALAISPYARGMGVDSTLYSTSSMLRTMELILGLEPMTQFDAAATPMLRSFKPQPDLEPYTTIDANVDLNAKNLASAWGADISETLDLDEEDEADDLLFGDIVWRSVRGADYPMPAPVRAAFVFSEGEGEEEDE